MDNDNASQRYKILYYGILAGYLIIFSRLYYLQIYLHDKYAMLSENNRFRIDPLPASRGIIYDKNGIVLAENKPSFQLIYYPKLHENLSAQIPWIQSCFKQKLELPSLKDQSIIARRLTLQELTCLAYYTDQTPSFALESRMIRHYPYGIVTTHLLGYLAPPTSEQSQTLTPTERKALYTMGRSGVESIYEKELRGQTGWDQREVNAKGKTIRYLDRIKPIMGKDIYLTLDIRIQKAAFDALHNHTGAIVALDPRNGNLLALASQPSFDANHFSYIITPKSYKALLDDPEKPLYNRATQGLYPLASIIKPFYGLAALEENVITAKESIQDAGHFSLPNSKHIFNDWKRSGHGVVNLDRAITVSCDTYFYKLSLKLGIERMAKWLHTFGFGHPVGAPLTMRTGLVPTPEWKAQRKEAWTLGDTVITGIGQGALLTTPLHAAYAVATLSQRGQGHTLRIHSASPITPNPPIVASDEAYTTIIEAMRHVITAADGTARALHDLPFSLAAKTGTAQVVSLSKHNKKKIHEDHHWLIGFAPVEHPRIAFAILIEHEHVALQVAKAFLQTWWAIDNADNASVS